MSPYCGPGFDDFTLTLNRIYKDKYMPRTSVESDERKGRSSRKDDDKKDKEKKPRDKSRTRTIFGGRRKEAVKSANERAELD